MGIEATSTTSTASPTLQGDVDYSKKGQPFIHLKYLLDLIEGALEISQQLQWVNKKLSALENSFLDYHGP
jgi:hypothetical protein